ncbi:MAG: DUF2459 domain-containing protein [Candidatus Tectomicrobia bacterium]|uniref:DUF2459 domain-containing protein n=1 Tax=Tectimicrobiota bacterium TaxID=2528274 RepID=A0A932HYI3_UNCTE|nr:DUF2459 domain-containing protein [Candidatus Tectomicrobia bacterium]
MSWRALARRMKGGLVLACLGGLAGCAALDSARPAPPAAEEGAAAHVVYVLSNRWHTSITLARGDLEASGLIPEAADLPHAAFFEFSLGDRKYFPAPRPGPGIALSALLVPTPSVLHVAGLARPPQEAYPDADVAAIRLGPKALAALIERIDASFDRAGAERAKVYSPGLYPGSFFYAARGKSHLFNTCNTWTARMLSGARPDLSPSGVVVADQVMHRVRALETAAPAASAPAGAEAASP